MTDTNNKKSTDGEAKAADKSQINTSSTNEYRFLLIKCINQITQMFPETIP